MALIKPYATYYGITASYHRHISTSYNSKDKLIEQCWAIYATAEARDAGGMPLTHEYVRIPYDALEADPRVAEYELAKTYGASFLRDAFDDQQAPAPQAPALLPEFRDPTAFELTPPTGEAIVRIAPSTAPDMTVELARGQRSPVEVEATDPPPAVS